MDACLALKQPTLVRREVATLTVSYKSQSDHDLIELTRKGEESAYAEIVARYQNPLTNYLYRMLNDYEEAVDLTQEAFVRVYLAIERYHSGYAFSTYIYRIATNLAITELRKRKRRKLFSLTGLFQFDGDEEVEFQPPDKRETPDLETVNKEKSVVIGKAIAALPDKYRAPIILREIQELSYEEIAEILELGLGTTKSRISRGRGLLRDRLKDYLGR
ncbi:MAG: sigma-70 family RNA polymerase sigma factor [Pyrinomonadaceae bacterium]